MQSVESLYSVLLWEGKPIATGSGFVVSRAGQLYLITARHCVTGRHWETNEPMDRSELAPHTIEVFSVVVQPNRILHRSVTYPLLDSEGFPLWFEHPIHQRKVDVVALPIFPPDGMEYQVLPHEFDPYPDQVIAAGMDVHVVGYPQDEHGGHPGFGVWTRATLATEYDVPYEDLPLYLVDAQTRTGQSGSPVFKKHWAGRIPMFGGTSVDVDTPFTKFVGVYTSRVGGQTGIGHVWRPEVVNEIIDGGLRFSSAPGLEDHR